MWHPPASGRVSWLGVALGGLLLAGCQAPSRPDIIVMLADDLGYQDVGFTGGTVIKTPNLDSMAASGAVLREFYVQSACSPTRAALMTGRYPMRYGLQTGIIWPWASYGLPLSERLLPQDLLAAGYSTAMVGKWHLGSYDPAYWPTARGFEHHYGMLLGSIDHFAHTRLGRLDWYRDGKPLREEGYSTHLLAREAVRVIETQPKDKPLFLYLPFNAVHAPFQVPEAYKGPYAALPEPRRTYAGMVAALDEAFGAVVAASERARGKGRTLYFFSGDNGGASPGAVADNGTLRGAKGMLYEGGVRACAFAAWPGQIKAGTEVGVPLHVVDLYPTLAGLAGAKTAAGLDGRDAWAAISRGAPSPHHEILLNAAPATGALRVGDWKLVINGNLADTVKTSPNRTLELFDLGKDPEERVNLATERPEKAADLLRRYDALAAQAVPALGLDVPSQPPPDH
jgi:arylsulfatase A-like enzyme